MRDHLGGHSGKEDFSWWLYRPRIREWPDVSFLVLNSPFLFLCQGLSSRLRKASNSSLQLWCMDFFSSPSFLQLLGIIGKMSFHLAALTLDFLSRQQVLPFFLTVSWPNNKSWDGRRWGQAVVDEKFLRQVEYQSCVSGWQMGRIIRAGFLLADQWVAAYWVGGKRNGQVRKGRWIEDGKLPFFSPTGFNHLINSSVNWVVSFHGPPAPFS